MRLRGMVVPNGTGSHTEGKGSPTEPGVASDGTPVGYGSPQWLGVIGWGDRESSLACGHRLQWSCGGMQPLMAKDQGLGEHGVRPSR